MLSLTACSDDEPAGKPGGVGSGEPVHFQEKVFNDPARRDMPAIRLLIPKEWKVEGSVVEVRAFGELPTLSEIIVRSPDGRGAHFWSMQAYGYADGVGVAPFTPYNGRPFFPIPDSLGMFWAKCFEINAPKGVTGLEIVSEEVVEDATAHVRKAFAANMEASALFDRQLRARGAGSKEIDIDARRLVIRYREGGKHIEATICGTLHKSIQRNPNGTIRAAMWSMDHLYGVSGPVGTEPLNDPVLGAVVRSYQMLPDWQLAIQRWYVMRNRQIVAEGEAAIAAASRAAVISTASQSQDVLDISFEGWKSRNAAGDAGQARSVNGIHERTTYVEPAGTTVDLPSYYQNVYTDGAGNYLLNDNANYEANTDPVWNGREWHRMNPGR